MSRRSFGTIRKTRKRFTAQYTGLDGARHTPGCSFPTRMDAEAWLAAERRLIDLGTWTPPAKRREMAESESEPSTTVGQWLKAFHDALEAGANPLKPSTLQNYRNVTKWRITAPDTTNSDVLRLSGLRLDKLTKRDVYRWWDGLQKAFPDSHTVNQQAYKRLKAALSEAVRREMIPTNPVDIPAAGRKVKTEEQYLPEDWEIQAAIDNTPEAYRLLTALTLRHGLRIGEAIALQVDDVIITPLPAPQLPRVSVHVRQNAQRISEGSRTVMKLMGSTKSIAGNRTVPIMPLDVPLVMNHLACYAPSVPIAVDGVNGLEKIRLLTVSPKGRIVMDTAYRNVLATAVKKAGANSKIKPHSGRRWLITRLAEQGAHLKEIGSLLGQDDVNTILGVYMQVRAGRTDLLMNKVGESLCSR